MLLLLLRASNRKTVGYSLSGFLPWAIVFPNMCLVQPCAETVARGTRKYVPCAAGPFCLSDFLLYEVFNFCYFF